MAKPCKVCSMPMRTKNAINRALIEGASPEKVAKRFPGKASINGVRRHVKAGHVPVYSPAALAESQGQVLMERRGLDHLKDIMDQQWTMFWEAKKSGQGANANTALRDLGANIERLTILSGEAAQAKIMSLANVTIDEKFIREFLQAVAQRPQYIVAFFSKECERLGLSRPSFVVNFVKPDYTVDAAGHRVDANGNRLPLPEGLALPVELDAPSLEASALSLVRGAPAAQQ